MTNVNGRDLTAQDVDDAHAPGFPDDHDLVCDRDCSGWVHPADRSPRSWSLPASPPEVREALGWFDNNPDRVRSVEGGLRSGRYAATVVRWLLSVVEGDRDE